MAVGMVPPTAIVFTGPDVKIIVGIGVQPNLAVASLDMVLGGFLRAEEPIGRTSDA